MSLYFDNFLTSNQVSKENVIDKYNTIMMMTPNKYILLQCFYTTQN